METSASIKEIASALKDWHALEISVTKDATNPHFKSKFTSLDNIIATIRTPLSKCGLAFAQFPDGDGLTTILTHTSGEWIKSTANLKLVKQDPQGQGSAYTYARRYALSAILGLATDEDDDGNEASKPSQKAHVAPQATKPTDPDTGAKIKMAGLMSDLGHKGLKGPAFTAQVKFTTGFDVVPENYEDIIRSLEALIDEKNSK